MIKISGIVKGIWAAMPSSKAQQKDKELERSGPLGKLRVYMNALGPDSLPVHLMMILQALARIPKPARSLDMLRSGRSSLLFR
jgi:hypothetical protein